MKLILSQTFPFKTLLSTPPFLASATKGINDPSAYVATDSLLGNNLAHGVIGETPLLRYNVMFGKQFLL